MVSRDLIVGTVMTIALLVLPFLIWTPWANVGENAILGHPHLVAVLWSFGPSGPQEIWLFETFQFYEILSYLALSLPNMLFVYMLVKLARNNATMKGVAITGLIGPLLFLIFGLPSMIFYYLDGYIVLNLPLPLLQIMGGIYLWMEKPS